MLIARPIIADRITEDKTQRFGKGVRMRLLGQGMPRPYGNQGPTAETCPSYHDEYRI